MTGGFIVFLNWYQANVLSNLARNTLSVYNSKTANAMQYFFGIANFKRKSREICKILNSYINNCKRYEIKTIFLIFFPI